MHTEKKKQISMKYTMLKFYQTCVHSFIVFQFLIGFGISVKKVDFMCIFDHMVLSCWRSLRWMFPLSSIFIAIVGMITTVDFIFL